MAEKVQGAFVGSCHKSWAGWKVQGKVHSSIGAKHRRKREIFLL